MLGAPSIFALGDCTSTSYAPTAQVASQQGAYLARIFKLIAKRDALEDQVKVLSSGEQLDDETTKRIETLKKKTDKIRLNPFAYSHQGSLACVSIVRRLTSTDAAPTAISALTRLSLICPYLAERCVVPCPSPALINVVLVGQRGHGYIFVLAKCLSEHTLLASE